MSDIYQQVTDRIIAALEQGFIPWRKQWKGASGTQFPSNFVTGRAYRGANVIVLLCSQHTSNQWLTYKQAQEIGAQVRKGEKGSPIIFWGRDTRTNKKGEEETYGFTRGYTVFNVEQCDGIPQSLPFDAPAFEPIDKAQSIADAFFARPAAPTLKHNPGAGAYYAPMIDGICMPNASCFVTPEAYYHTLYHEMTHATGAKCRLDRGIEGHQGFGSETYSKEELVAEFGASFISAEAGISSEGMMENAAAYIGSWLKQLRDDKQLAITAAQAAQKAADYILARSFSPAT